MYYYIIISMKLCWFLKLLELMHCNFNNTYEKGYLEIFLNIRKSKSVVLYIKNN